MIPSSPFSNLENGESISSDPRTVTPPQPSLQLITPPAVDKTESSPLGELPKEQLVLPTQTTKNTKRKAKSAEGATRRKSTRVSIVPNRFQPEANTKKPSSTPSTGSENGFSMTAQNTPTVASTGDTMEMETSFTATPTPKARIINIKFAENAATPVAVEDISEAIVLKSSPPGPEEIGEEVSHTKGDRVRDSAELIFPEITRGKSPLKAEDQDTPAKESIGEGVVKLAPQKRSYRKRTTALAEEATTKVLLSKNSSGKKTRKSTTPVKEIAKGDAVEIAPPNMNHLEGKSTSKEETAGEDMVNTIPDLSDKYPIESRKRSLSEETATEKRSHRRSKPEDPRHRKYLVAAPTSRKTRSQNASNSRPANSPTESPALETPSSETPVLKKRIFKTRTPRTPVVKTPVLKTSTPPRLSNMIFRSPLRAMIKSATEHYSFLPTNLTDRFAIAALHRTFFADDTYREHLKVLGLEGDDKDVRSAMRQVWEIVNNGEKDDEVVWEILAATWDSQGARGWGNDV